jgi:hypothetical protein
MVTAATAAKPCWTAGGCAGLAGTGIRAFGSTSGVQTAVLLCALPYLTEFCCLLSLLLAVVAACCCCCLRLQPKEVGLPFTAYTAIDEVREVRERHKQPMAAATCAIGLPTLSSWTDCSMLAGVVWQRSHCMLQPVEGWGAGVVSCSMFTSQHQSAADLSRVRRCSWSPGSV